jgi:hypothetical protein
VGPMDVFVSWRDVTYEPVRGAGAGGIGKVSVALATTEPNKGVLFAVKTFSPDSPEKEDWKQAFMREAHVLRDCNHPAIVKVFDEGVLGDGRPFFVMEYLPDTLWAAMKANSLDDPAKVSIVMQLLSALDYLSRRDPYVVHRDVKPRNIFLKAGTCVLGDFGLVFQDVAPAAAGQTEGVIPAMAQMYRTPELVEYNLTGKKPPPDAKGWVKLPRRWVVERTFAWLGRYRINSKEHERLTASSEAQVHFSSIRLMLKMLKPSKEYHEFKYRRHAA